MSKSYAALMGAFLMITSAHAAAPQDRPEIVGHRGASADAPENTLASVRLAWEHNADGAEVDVYLTADGRVVCYHDKDLKRTSGDERLIAETTLADLRDLEAGAWKDAKWAGEPIPLLQHVLMTIPEGKRLFVEIKCGPEITEQLVNVVTASGKSASQITFISFNPDSCRAIKQALPAHEVYYLHSFKKDKNGVMQPSLDELIVEAKDLGVDGLDVSYKGNLTPETIGRVHEAGLFFAVWTVDDVALARHLADIGVDSITTNTPRLMLQAFEGL